MIYTEQIKYNIGAKNILNEISIQFLPAHCNLIVGPNGSGKSTFIKLLSGEIENYEGSVLYQGVDIKTFTTSTLAKTRAVLSQHSEFNFPMTVEEVVMMGRTPYFQFNPSSKDKDIVQEVMQLLDIDKLYLRNFQTLSGGEKQRVHFARVLAQIWESPHQEHRYLFLDEPLNNLDMYYQELFLSIAISLLNEKTTLIGVVHDLNIALRYADHLSFFKEGRIIKNGSPSSIVDVPLIKQVFNIDTQIITHPSTSKPIVLL